MISVTTALKQKTTYHSQEREYMYIFYLHIWKDKPVLQMTKVWLLWSLMFPNAVYGFEA